MSSASILPRLEPRPYKEPIATDSSDLERVQLVLLNPVFTILHVLLNLYFYVVLIRVLLSLLFQFEIIPYRNQAARAVEEFCAALTEPFLKRIPSRIRFVGQFDLGPMILMLVVLFLQLYLTEIQRWALSPAG